MKNNLDERQNQEVRQIAANAFYIMFIISAVSIVIQLVLLGQGMKSVLGETVILLAGGGAADHGSMGDAFPKEKRRKIW